ncbi:hypothetical protein [Bacteroides faecis]|uniref:hypothetical protein n=1 Tax=Bacteroides faecis TaxID=674529 RepID=UPI0018AB8188|nr:hypothetical protein [Bacteroides faecis]
MVKINGVSFEKQYRRTTSRPIDSTDTWKSKEDAESYARNTDAEPYVPYDGQVISIEGEEDIYILVKDDTISTEDGRKHFKLHKISTEEGADDKYLSKVDPDSAKGLITFLAGIDVKIKAVIQKLIAEDATFSKEISSKDYVQNLIGWMISPDGHIDAKSLHLRDFLEVPELRYNRVSITSGEDWLAPGGGIIESVNESSQTLTLKLEPGEVASLAVDDICKGIFNNSTGFQTSYFRITQKISNSEFKYTLRSGYSYHPQKAMHFVAYGNFTNAERQKSAYSTKDYKRYLAGVNNWEITSSMVMMQLGDLSNLVISGLDLSGYSAYLRNVYMTGTIKQLSQDGTTEVLVPAFKGEWKAGKYWYYDEVTHNGSTWICIEPSTTQEPSDSSTDWLKEVSKGDPGTPGKDGIPGKDGADGRTSYFHVKYSPVQNPTSSQMKDTPDVYIGTYVDFVQANSTDPSKYTWARFQGIQGENGTQGIPGVNGEDGRTSYLHIKYSNDGKTFTANNGETPGAWIGQYVDFVQSDSSVFSDYKWQKIKGEDGADGKDGVGVQDVDVLYYLSTSSSTLTGGSWSTTAPAWVNGKYMWSKTRVIYTDGSTTETDPACITGSKGANGTNGEDGRGVTSIVEQYYLSTSSSSLVGGSWSTTAPAWVNGKYIWTRSVITYTDGSSTTTDAICVTGAKGETGIGVKSYREQYYLSTSYSTPAGGSWSYNVPSWTDGKFMWTRTVVTYTDNTTWTSDPVCVTGSAGPSGKGVKSFEVLYYLSTSSSSLVGGSWSTTAPKWEDGKYIWTKTKVTYTDNTTYESSPACLTGGQGKTGLPGAMLRPRGEWKPNTEYYHNDAFIDTVIYNGNNKLCKVTHTSTSTFDSTKWDEFNEFINVATNVLLAQNATIDVLGTSGIFVGNLEKTQGWMITEGAIKHNQTGFELTAEGGINTANGKLVLTSNSTVIRTNTGKDIALFKEVDGVPMIDAKNINTENLVVTSGAILGGWEIKDNNIVSRDIADAKILLEVSGTRFLRINEYGGVSSQGAYPFLSIRNDNQDCINLSTYGKGGVALRIIANTAGGGAIESYGSHLFGQRQYEKWDAPGVLWAGRISSGGGISDRWGDGCYVSSIDRTDTGNYVFWHELGHTNYFVIATGVNENWTLCIISDKQANTFTVKTFHKDQGWINSAFEVAVIGRNRK